jgi:hypothetical protein
MKLHRMFHIRCARPQDVTYYMSKFRHGHFNPLNVELNPICYLLALLGAHPILHVSGIRVNVEHRYSGNISRCHWESPDWTICH